jgi:hypothetical protein
MMSGEAWLYLLAVLINAVNLFLQVFFTIMYSDLEWWVNLSSALLAAPICVRRNVSIHIILARMGSLRSISSELTNHFIQ